MTAREVLLDGGSPWGFRMHGGADVGHPLRISRVNPGSKAAQKGVREGDVISTINGQSTRTLNNGDSHALLRSVGDSLRLGLNQDSDGSPKRRSKEPLKKEKCSGSTQSIAAPGLDATPESAASTPDSVPSDLSEGAKVFVCGIWNSVSKGKHTTKHGKKTENTKSIPEAARGQRSSEASAEAAPKASSSKARRLRKLKLKSAKKEEEAVKEQVSDDPKQSQDKSKVDEVILREEAKADDQVELVIVMDENVVRRAGGEISNSENYFSEIDSDSKGTSATIVEVVESSSPATTPKSTPKNKNNKSKGFLSQIFGSKPGKSPGSKSSTSKDVQILENNTSQTNSSDEEKEQIKSITVETSDDVLQRCLSVTDKEIDPSGLAEKTSVENKEVIAELHNKETILDDSKDQIASVSGNSIYKPPTTFTIFEIETGPTKTDQSSVKSPFTTLYGSKAVATETSETPNLIATNTGTVCNSTNEQSSTQPNKIYGTNETCDDLNCAGVNFEEENSRPISIFVVPPDNVAEEAEAPRVNWESASDMEAMPVEQTDVDDVRPETLIHLPSNDMQTSAVLRDGRNGIIKVDDYELSVRDLHTPFIDPEEEANLRCFLETLNLTKPEEYDDTSSSKSLGDSSSTSMSGTSPIPPTAADEVVIYRHMKTHSIAEPCFIPPKHHRHLDVITEEVSDPSDSERRNKPRNPWESSEMIRKNNEILEIPNDWYGSDEEPMTTSDEGGIDTSWRDGRKLEDVEGVEIIYLSESDDGDDEESGSKTCEGSISSMENRESGPELVVVHAIDNTNVKSKVKLQPLIKQENKTSVNETKSNVHNIDEIVAIIDSTFEINKDLFTIQPPTKPKVDCIKSKEIKSSSNIEIVSKEKLKSNFFKDPVIVGSSLTSTLAPFDSDKNGSLVTLDEKIYNHEPLNDLPAPQVKLVLTSSPALSRQGSSSSATSQSTTKYNPGQSPMSSEAEDKSDKCSSTKQKKRSVQKMYNPKSLTALSKEIVTNNSFGDFYLQKIGFVASGPMDNGFGEGNLEVNNGKVISLPPSGLSTRRSSFHELENIYSSSNYYTPIEIETCPPQPIFVPSPPPSALTTPPFTDNPWVGVPTSTDPRLLVCFSPSQSKDTVMASTKEATDLLDLHRKFVERRGYHESRKRNSISRSPKSERSSTPDLCSPDLIRLEPYECKHAPEYTPELLIEAANLLALKEYRRSRFKSASQPHRFKTETTEINDGVLKKNGGLSGVTSPATEINGDSEDSNRSAGTSRLLALLQDGGAPCNDTASDEMERVDKAESKKPDRAHRYSGSYISDWLTMSENVTSTAESAMKTDFNRNVIDVSLVSSRTVTQSQVNINDAVVEKRQFEADKYKISKQGDIAIMQTKEDPEVKPRLKNERPKSLPPVGVPAISPTGNEVFREKMYHEYMSKVAERSERRQQKVIRISSRPSSVHSLAEPEVEKPQNPPANQLESEFLSKARERMSKLGINLDQEPHDEEVEEEKKPEEELPKHLQEFIELTAAPQADAVQNTCTGVWSPGATPEAQRKQFDFSEVKEEQKEAQDDSDPVPPVWTPKSAQASPVLERKFRSVNFESPKASRKTYNNKPSEGAPKPPTDLPLSLDSPTHSQTSSSVSSSTQYLSSTRETTTSTHTQESSGRLVTSHSLPDTSADNKLPRAQNPTITLLQKAREGQLPRGAHYLEENQTNRSSPPAVRPNDILYSERREYESETDVKKPKRVEIPARKVDGIGPITKEGIPVVLRSEVQDENQQKWYKRMYDSLHRAEQDSRLPYASAGYQSEPEPVGSYDSDYASAKYATLDRRRIRNKDSDFTTSTMPRTKYNAVKHGVDIYKNQPGRIEDYEPGHSSIADKEAKQWWDEVMDIFDGQFEQSQKASPRTHAPATSSTNKPFMTYALKESGYESDSTLVFKRRDETQQQLSPAEQRQAYKSIQRGGEVPLHGLRKPVPDKPKGPDDSDLEYFPISPHLTRIRIHKKKQVIKPVKEILCYPVTSIELDKPPPVFSSYKRTAKTSSNLASAPEVSSTKPPSPPRRRSSHNSSTLRLYSKMSISPSPKRTRLTRSLSSGVEVDSNVQYLRDRITSKLGVSSNRSTDKQKNKDGLPANSSVGKTNRYILRTGSLSPSLHTTVTTSPCGTTRVTKRTSLERKPSLRSRRDLGTPTRLAKSSELRAPAEVKKVLKQREVKERSSSSKSLPPGTVVKSSTTLYSSSRGSSKKAKEDKQLKVTVAISAKGRELLRSSSMSSTSGLRDTSVSSLSKQTETTTATTSTTTVQPVTSSSPTVPKSLSPRPSSRSDSDKRPGSRSSFRGSPTDRGIIKSPVEKIVTPPTVPVSPLPSSDLLKKPKKGEDSSEVPKKKKDKNGVSTSKSVAKNSSVKKNSKEYECELNGKKRLKRSKDAESPPSSKKLAKKNGIKKSREKTDQKKSSQKAHSTSILSSKDNRDGLVGGTIKKVSTPEFSDLDCKVTATKAFFQNLLMRNMPCPTPSNTNTLQRTSSVLERAQKFGMSDGYSSLPYRSEPSLGLVNVYLKHKKPVSESKFRSLDREITSNRSSRSQSPLYCGSRRFEFLEKIDKFDQMNNVWDKTNYYAPLGYRERSPELFKERSSSEPPRVSPTHEDQCHENFGNIQNAHWDYDNMTPPISRSPSCRRIRSGRTAVKTIESIEGLRRKGARAKSLSEADGKPSLARLQAHSTSSLNLSHVTDHSDYQTYVMELLHSTKKSDRFKELYKFYTSLERMGQLERTTSNIDLRPRKKGEEIIDYDRWKQLRTKERAEEELKSLYGKLKDDQKEKDLLFEPRDSLAIKWKGDRGLRGKERSVEDLRQRFQRMAHEDSDMEMCRRRDIDASKDVYKPLWRGSSVVNLASSLTSRTARRGRSVSEVDQTASSIPRPVGSRCTQAIGSRLWSSLSMEQVNALKNQLSEIYNTVSSLKRDRINKMLKGKPYLKEFEILVPPEENEKVDQSEPLHVRCNSLLTKEQLYSPLNRRKEGNRSECKKADSISSIPNWKGSRDSGSGSGDSSHSSLAMPLSESEKKKLSMSLSEEVKSRVSKKYGEDKKKKRRVSSSIVIPRETLGAVAAIKGTKKTGRTKSPSPSDSSPRTCYSIEMSEDGSCCKQTSSTSSHGQGKDFLLVLTPKDDDVQEVKKVVDEWAECKSRKKSAKDERVVARLVQTTSNSETDSGSSEASTVIHLGSREDVQKKVDYFESKTGKEDSTNVDGRVSRSAGDVRPFNEEIKHRAKSAPSAFSSNRSKSNLVSSQSFSDLKELLGEKRASEYATAPLRKVSETTNNSLERVKHSQQAVDSGLQSSEESLRIRSRSISPDPMKYYRAYLSMVKAGDVRKLREKFESMDDLYTITDEENLRVPSPPPKRHQSDPDLTKEFFARKSSDSGKTVIKGQEVGDVKCLKKKYESQRGRQKTRRAVSPVPLKSDNRFMPHINVISKLATLQQQRSQTVPARPGTCAFRTGEVDRLRQQFEAQQLDLSLLGQMYTSAPDVRELRDIAPYLECNWVAHQHPKPRSLSSPETQRSLQCSPKPRPASSSPIRRQTHSILKSQQKKQRDMFAKQHFDPSIHRPLYRYQPPSPCVDTSYHYRPWIRDPYWWWRHYWFPSTKPTVTFKEPLRGQRALQQRVSFPPQRRPESPHRYVESEVTIHYRSPVRSEEKEAWSEEELQRRQAEAMRRIYQEERRRKYLQELQDMYSRRHTDNFTPSQKSPIPLNRYDDFVDDLSPGKPRDRTPEPKLVARALYNFVGQTSRELTFRRGDIIYVRRQIDKNWYEGEHNAMIGLFPFNYVEIIPYDGIRTLPKRPTEGQARAKFNFQAQTHLELPLVKGELLLLTRRVDQNWFEGRIGNRKGIFPVSYVDVLVEPGERAMSPVRVNTPTKPVASPAAHSLHMSTNTSQHHYQPPRPVSYTSLRRQKTADLKQPPVNQTLHIDTQSEPVPYRVLYNYKPQNEDELELVEGETVYVMEKCDDGWYVGSSQRTGYLGTFPGNYVERQV